MVPEQHPNPKSGSENNPAIVRLHLIRRRGDKAFEEEDSLVREEPLEIRVRGQGVAVTMRTPGHDPALAAGFLLSEGLIRRRSDVIEIAHCPSSGPAPVDANILNVFVSPSLSFDLEKLTRHVFASSSCGLCGKASIDAVHQHFPPLESRVRISSRVLLRFPDLIRQAQSAFNQTGGLHAAGIFDSAGDLIVLHEDVGRHNAVDKVIGHGFLEDLLPWSNHVLMISGRASFEIMQKALAARIPIVAAVSAPSHLAVEFARESGQTLAGFLRGNSMNIYAHPERIFD
jgi:FdhD protein